MNHLKQMSIFLVLCLFTGISSITQLFADKAPAPLLAYPLANYGCANYEGIWLEWTNPQEEANMDYYIIQVDTSANFNPPIINEAVSGFIYKAELPNFYNKKFYWRVRARYNSPKYPPPNNDTAWSETRIFHTRKPSPALVSPVDNISCMKLDEVVLKWRLTIVPSVVVVQVSENEEFDDNVFEYQTTSSLLEDEILLDAQFKNILTNAPLALKNDTKYYWRVRDECPDNWSVIRTFITKPAAPQLQYPVDLECADLEIDFQWEELNGLTHYDIQVSSLPDFSTIDYQLLDIYDKHYVLKEGTLKNYTKYYWRIRATFEDGCKSEWSLAESFTTLQSPPQLRIPANNALSQPIIGIELNWNIDEAISYVQKMTAQFDLEMAYDPNFENLVFPRINNVTRDIVVNGIYSNQYKFALPNDWSVGERYNTKFYWRIRTHLLNEISYSYCLSEWSETFIFRTKYETPAQIYPTDEISCIPLDCKFQWGRVNNSSKYRLQVAKNDVFANPEIDLIVSGLEYEAMLKDGFTTYFWRVRAEDENNTSDWTSAYQFTTTALKPVLLQPVDIKINTLTYLMKWDFAWQVVNEPTYTVLISKNADMSNAIIFAENITEKSIQTANLEYRTNYYWQVIVKVNGCESKSAIAKFTTSLKPPVLVYPTNNSNDLPLNITCYWGVGDDADLATTYNFIIATDPDFISSSIVSSVTNHSGTFIEVNGLLPSKTYYWKVSVNSDNYGTSDWSETWLFKTGIPVIVLREPANKSVQVPINCTFKWDAVNGVDGYMIQVSKDFRFNASDIVISKLVNTNQLYSTGELKNYETYYWRVATVVNSNTSAWSEIWNFRTIAETLPAPILQTPFNSSVGVPVELIPFSWQKVTNAEEYTLQIALTNNFMPEDLVINLSGITSPFQAVSNLEVKTTYYWRVLASNEAGDSPWSEVWTLSTSKELNVNDAMNELYSISATPNPFSAQTKINFGIDNYEYVRLSIHNLAGQEISVLLDKELPSGNYSIPFNANNLQQGIYFYKLQINRNSAINKIILVK